MYATLTTHLETITVERAGAVAYLTLDRPAAKNAMNQKMVEEIRDFFGSIRDDRSIRCVVLRGAGGIFCAGADIKEMSDPTMQTPEAQHAYAAALDQMLEAIQFAPQATIAWIEGVAMGGGFGIACVADIAIADGSAAFSLPEVRLGLAPAVISPFVLERIGLARARQLALSGRRLNGHQAEAIGLVHEVALEGEIESLVAGYVRDILRGGPEALAATKSLLFHVAGRSTEESRAYRVETLARLRAGDEGKEGMGAFREKRRPAWDSNEELGLYGA